VPGPKLGQLGPSTTCEIEHVEKEDKRLVLLERVCERELVAARGGQLELWRLIPDRKHLESLFRVTSAAGLAGVPPAMTLY